MDYAEQRFEAAYTLDQAVEFAESANDNTSSHREEFNEEIDAWARHALAANGFGDCF